MISAARLRDWFLNTQAEDVFEAFCEDGSLVIAVQDDIRQSLAACQPYLTHLPDCPKVWPESYQRINSHPGCTCGLADLIAPGDPEAQR